MKKYFGNKDFYKAVLIILVPVILQNGISNFVSMLDNIMVGQLGTEQMSGVAIVNQLLYVFYVSIFGGVAGPGLFGAQYYGKGDDEGMRYTFRYKIYICLIITVIGTGVLIAFGPQLISLYLNDTAGTGNAVLALKYGKVYLGIILFSFIFYAITQIYASSLRETGQTVVPMISGMIAVGVNIILDYIFIFGKMGVPALGVKGAAVATVIARIVECLINIIWAHKNKERNRFVVGLYRSLKIPAKLVVEITKKGAPLIINEILWALGTALIAQCYAFRGLDGVAAYNISTVISNVFSSVFFSFGTSISVMVGQLLGANKIEEAKDTDRKLLTFAVLVSIVIAVMLTFIAELFPDIYNTSENVKSIATGLILATAVVMPLQSYANAAYFTIRSGGRTGITFLFDSGFVWVIMLPSAYCIAHFTAIPLITMYLIVQGSEVIKCIIGAIMIKNGIWAKNIVSEI